MIVPARGGSKSIPRKNVKPIAGRPLAVWAIEAGIACPGVDRVVLATDDPAIAEAVQAYVSDEKLSVFWRCAENAHDTAPTEAVMAEVLATRTCERVLLAQPTSPLLRAADLNGGLTQFDSANADSLVSVVRQKRFIWRQDSTGAVALNYDPSARPRRQDFDGLLVENGAFYICDAAGFHRQGSRLFGRITAYEMPEDTYIELDEPNDWALVEMLLRQRAQEHKEPNGSHIRLVLSDIDGVLTDAGMYYAETGDELKKFNTRDGAGIARLRDNGIRVGLITRENRTLNARRAEKLKVDFIEQGATDKIAAARPWLAHYGLSWDEVAYIGDDIYDVPLLQKVGWPVAPGDAMEPARSAARTVTRAGGGEGCLRELADICLQCLSGPPTPNAP